jgi:hypothetical protein
MKNKTHPPWKTLEEKLELKKIRKGEKMKNIQNKKNHEKNMKKRKQDGGQNNVLKKSLVMKILI